MLNKNKHCMFIYNLILVLILVYLLVQEGSDRSDNMCPNFLAMFVLVS